jgi:hypothetical protein
MARPTSSSTQLLPSHALLPSPHALLLPSHALLLPSLSPPLCRDNLVAQGKESKVSAAVVFLPKNTLHFGKCGSDKCYCVEVGISLLLLYHHLLRPLASPSNFCPSSSSSSFQMYGEKKEWGCKWFQLWREHIKNAVSLDQRLQVFFYEGLQAKARSSRPRR